MLKFFCKLDAISAFWQRKLAEKSKLLTTFITPWESFHFERLSYGISTGSEQFQKVMTEKLAGLGVECQIDGIVLHGRNQEIHDKRLHAVLKCLEESNITLNMNKCKFDKSKDKVLGQHCQFKQHQSRS